MTYIHFMVVVLGAVYILSESIIFAPFRAILRTAFSFCGAGTYAVGTTLLYCPACLGFWLGLIFHAWWPVVGDMALVEAPLGGMLLGRIWAQYFPGTAFEVEVLNGTQKAGNDGK